LNLSLQGEEEVTPKFKPTSKILLLLNEIISKAQQEIGEGNETLKVNP